ncbi:beta-glucosidase [Klebsiella spallanzanii]|uniref:beta-glucosidase n=1 Tax=Klebsiella spallanzanii TaxID=2587528 RepID=UPI002595EE40|nr:glycoside hydrolase family 3 C-terminal domain-containing protein [Klebsiella spallanzanii]MDM4206781.1 glycoside hydrolase family 3 C-terminal domain-containing protein [Klebsiella spallanzanii]
MNNDVNTTLAAMSAEDKVALLTGSGLWRTASLPQYGIEDIIMTDGTYGVRYSSAQIDGREKWSMDDFISVITQTADQASAEESAAKGGSEALFSASLPATCFPNGSSLACSWDVELVHQMGQALGTECQQMGVGILLGPGINIRRTPLAGRGYEYYAEDPIVSGDIAAALINGLQQEGVGASLKHFAANNSEYRRTEMDSIIEERALREIYLAGFQRAIAKSQPWTVMSSYNRLNGVQTSQDPFLLTQVLRDEWGYSGLVMSDWYGIKDRPASLMAGNDLAMPETRRDKQTLLAAIEAGDVPMAVVDRACLRMLELLNKVQCHRRPQTRADFPAHHALAQRLAGESIVLLKNENDLLPLRPEKTPRIAVLGKPAQEPVIQGSGCATTVPYLLDRPLDEIFDLAGDDFSVSWAVGAPDDLRCDEQALAQACSVAQEADVAVLFVSTAVGEDGENGDRQDLNILPVHERLIREVAAVQPNVVVVLANSDAVVMPWLGECKVLLETFFAGQGMGRAVAEILFGQRNPCGKLTVTVPNTLEETPAWLHYPGENLRHHYGEGLFVGYRYYDKRRLTPLFPFGFGLSYTRFAYDNIALSTSRLGENDTLTVSFDLTNCGEFAGKEVVQLYVSAPEGELIREVQALKAFSKVALSAGESRRVSLQLPVAELACYHPGLGDWVVMPGIWQIRVGGSSRDLPLTAEIEIDCPPRYVPLRDDNSLQQLIQQPEVFARVVELIADKSQLPPEQVREKLIRLAPDLFCGLLIALTEFLALDIDRDELNAVLAGTDRCQ